MIDKASLIAVADAYIAATDLPETTVSHRVFGDTKKLAMLRGESDITVGRFNAAMTWFSCNWPAAGFWPANIDRPLPLETAMPGDIVTRQGI